LRPLRRSSREIVDGDRPDPLGDASDAHTGMAQISDFDPFRPGDR